VSGWVGDYLIMLISSNGISGSTVDLNLKQCMQIECNAHCLHSSLAANNFLKFAVLVKFSLHYHIRSDAQMQKLGY